MALSKNAFRSAIEPFFGKYCLVAVISDGIEFELLMRLDNFSEVDGVMRFSRHAEDKLELDLRAASDFDFGNKHLASPRLREKFDKIFESVASARVNGTFRVALLFGKI